MKLIRSQTEKKYCLMKKNYYRCVQSYCDGCIDSMIRCISVEMRGEYVYTGNGQTGTSFRRYPEVL